MTDTDKYNFFLESLKAEQEDTQKTSIKNMSEVFLFNLCKHYMQVKEISSFTFNPEKKILKIDQSLPVFVEFIQKLPDDVAWLFLNKIADSVFRVPLGFLTRNNIKFFYGLYQDRVTFLLRLINADLISPSFFSEEELIIYTKIYSSPFSLSSTIDTKNFLIITTNNDTLLNTIFLKDNLYWFKNICELIKKMPPISKDCSFELMEWETVLLNLRDKFLTKRNPGCDLIIKTIFNKFIEPSHSFNTSIIYSLLDPEIKHLFTIKNYCFQENYLEKLIIPYYISKSSTLILSSIFKTRNKKDLLKLSNHFLNKDSFRIDTSTLLITSTIANVFSNYGIRNKFLILARKKRFNEAFCDDFRRWFMSFSACLSLLVKVYGEHRVFKLLENSDWDEDFNMIESFHSPLLRILKKNLVTPEYLRKIKPKQFSGIHTTIFKLIGDYETSTNLIELKKESIGIDGLKIDDFKFVLPDTNVQLHRFSVEMGNCVRGYSEKINDQGSQIINVFKSNKPYANIEIVNFKVNEIKGKYNKDLDLETIDYFYSFLKENNIIK